MASLSLTPAELDALLQAPPPTFSSLVLDVRSEHCFRRGHVPGSHHIPSGLLVSGEFPDCDLVLVATTDVGSHQLAEQLHGAGFHRQIQYLHGGFDAWRKAGFPIQVASPIPTIQATANLAPRLTPLAAAASLAQGLHHAATLVVSLALSPLMKPWP